MLKARPGLLVVAIGLGCLHVIFVVVVHIIFGGNKDG